MTSLAPAKPETTDLPDQESVTEPQLPWLVIVWNDPINLMSYVVYVFQKLFGYGKEKATQLMLESLFEIRWRVRDIHEAVVEGEDDGEAEEEEDT